MCARNDQGGAINPLLPVTELSLAQVQRIFAPEFIRQLKKIYLCGNFGDPVMAKDLPEILRYFRHENPDLNLGIHTNGGARDTGFWTEMASIVSYCRFGIDGLADTNHLYRQGVKWEILERNLRAFTQAGGQAEWDFLVFKHNQHQTEEAQSLARQWGVKKINIKSTSRFFSSQKQALRGQVPVHNQKGETTHFLEKSTLSEFENPFYQQQEKTISSFGTLQNYWDRAEISCKVAAEKNIYVTAQGHVLPCCWIGNEIYAKYIHSSQNQVLQMLESLPEGGLDSLNALKRDLADVLASDLFQKNLESSWNKNSIAEGKLRVCARTCGDSVKPFEGQFL
jgi:MoaA/NifB/PqqE/SkfB family radical SAM enzyme